MSITTSRPELVKYGIGIDAYNADTEPSRLRRLDLLREILHYNADALGSPNVCVYFVYDHKGILAVGWTAKPDEHQMGMVDGFWESVFFEYQVDHFFDGVLVGGEDLFDGAPFLSYGKLMGGK